MEKDLDPVLKTIIKDKYFSYNLFDPEEGAKHIEKEIKWDYNIDLNEEAKDYIKELYKK